MNFNPKPSRKHSAHDWIDYLRESDGLGEILAKTEDLAKLKIILNAALIKLELGHLGPKIEAGWRSGTKEELFLLVNSASVASRLQQILPSLINALSKSGLLCKTIKVRVKPAPPSWAVKPRANTQRERPQGLNAVAKKSWESLLEKLEPNSGLRSPIEKLLKTKPK
ncbi:hypothetical protein [Polynucleobacter necessarius]|uniref:hypothetical protein n=1 Tax=Polynucleobacter necessarius TaxID=576610 RepID=UPI000E08D30E|nr:hypothetical protein [Polynucleobacter necessarius]HAT38916.1 hypothetical protein [Polynucleobacter sp.]